jgi:tetratricopeptide (TPR) repeat protein
MMISLVWGNSGLADDLAPAVYAKEQFARAQRLYQEQPTNTTAGWEFARATFDLAEFATNHTERARLAELGIAASRKVITANTNLAAGHYYLGMNLGQLARTETLGALRLVSQMEKEFLTARRLDNHFDNAGPDRNLGLLYREAPAIASIGNRTKAREHLQRAVELAPGYPENRLNLLEGELKWNDRNRARRELKNLEEIVPKAQRELVGPAWTGAWADWTERLEIARKKLGEPARIESPHR